MDQESKGASSLTQTATYYAGTPQNGTLTVSEATFAFTNDQAGRLSFNLAWTDIAQVLASVSMRKKISRFTVITKDGNQYQLSAKDSKAVLRAMREHLQPAQLVRAKGVLDVFKRHR